MEVELLSSFLPPFFVFTICERSAPGDLTDSHMELVMVDPGVRWKYIRSTMDSQMDYIYGVPDAYQAYHFFIK